MSVPPPPPPPAPPPPPLDEQGFGWRPMSPLGQPLASPGIRLVARLLDVLILGLINVALGYLLITSDDSAGFGGFGGDLSFGELYLLAVAGVCVGFVWDAVMTRLYGGSPMKLAFGMRVVRADNGGSVEWHHAIVRWAIPGAFALLPLPILPGVLSLVAIVVSLVFIFSRPLRQAVWDQVAKTLVVKHDRTVGTSPPTGATPG